MKKCRCKCRRAGETTPQSAALTAPLTRGAGERNRDVQTVKECQDWLIGEYDLEVKRLTAERDKAIEELEDVAALKKENLQMKRDKQELLEELRRMKHENEVEKTEFTPPVIRPAWCPRKGRADA